jgi:hypothetical protein
LLSGKRSLISFEPTPQAAPLCALEIQSNPGELKKARPNTHNATVPESDISAGQIWRATAKTPSPGQSTTKLAPANPSRNILLKSHGATNLIYPLLIFDVIRTGMNRDKIQRVEHPMLQ